jgi:hypothetical protein
MGNLLAIVAAVMGAGLPLGQKVPEAHFAHAPSRPQDELQKASPIARRQNFFKPPTMLEVITERADRGKRREWRDRPQTHAIIWNVATGRYFALEIHGDRYQTLPAELDRRGHGHPRPHLTYSDAVQAIDEHWRFMSGHKPSPRRPSHLAQRLGVENP